MRVNGLFGHIQANHKKSLMLFGGFLLSFQVLATLVIGMAVAVSDPEHAPFINWTGYLTRYVPLTLFVGTLIFAVQILGHTNNVARRAGFHIVTKMSEQRLLRILEPLALAMGLPTPKIAILEHGALNAFACGIIPSNAMIVVTRNLVDALDDDELAAVLAHELAHIRNGDIFLMACANILMRDLLLIGNLSRNKEKLRAADPRAFLILVLLPGLISLLLLSGLILELAVRSAWRTRRIISSSREFIADAEAVQATQNPSALISALNKIGNNSVIHGIAPELHAMMIDGAVEGKNATHPTIAARIAILKDLLGPMAVIAPNRRDTRERQAYVSSGAGNRPAVALFGRRKGLACSDGAAVSNAGAGAMTMQARTALFEQNDIQDDCNIFGFYPKQMRYISVAILVSFFIYPVTLQTYSPINWPTSGGSISSFLVEATQMQYACTIGSARHHQPLTDEYGLPNPSNPCTNENMAKMMDKYRPSLGVLGKFATVNVYEFDKSIDYETGLPPNEYGLNAYEAYARLSISTMPDLVETMRCGVPVSIRVSGDNGQRIVWRVYSDGKEIFWFAANLTPIANDRIKVSMEVSQDIRGGEANNGKQNYFRPVLAQPIRPALNAQIGALLTNKPFQGERLWRMYNHDSVCSVQKASRESGFVFSVNDLPGETVRQSDGYRH